MTLCQNAFTRERHEIADRELTVSIAVNWGAADLRADTAQSYAFCSYACLAAYAAQRAEDHDGVVVKDGAA